MDARSELSDSSKVGVMQGKVGRKRGMGLQTEEMWVHRAVRVLSRPEQLSILYTGSNGFSRNRIEWFFLVLDGGDIHWYWTGQMVLLGIGRRRYTCC